MKLRQTLSGTNSIPWDLADLPSVSSEHARLLCLASSRLLSGFSESSPSGPWAPSRRTPRNHPSSISLFYPLVPSRDLRLTGRSLIPDHHQSCCIPCTPRPNADGQPSLRPSSTGGTCCCHTCVCRVEQVTATVTGMHRRADSAGDAQWQTLTVEGQTPFTQDRKSFIVFHPWSIFQSVTCNIPLLGTDT